jgi:NitT/TauT family transport system substrate-binding protein/putative hydroxymethylpyrimidine transport system substrate-binding protein
MRRVAALLAAAILASAIAGCGDGGAEPGAPKGATLVLDFQPNAVHSGIYAAQANGYFKDEGLDLTIREPSSTADSPKLLASGRADFAVMDINDFGIARERGLDIAAIAAIVQTPLASVIARDRNEIRTPADLAGKTVGVTGVPSDDAVLDTVLRSGGVDPSSVHRVTIGFNAVSALAAGKIDAATAFWNAEGVELQRMGVPIREFRVDQFGAPRYPELVVATSRGTYARIVQERAQNPNDSVAHSNQLCPFLLGLQQGYENLGDDPQGALSDLLHGVPGLDRTSQEAQFRALTSADAFSETPQGSPTPITIKPTGANWARWAQGAGLIDDAAAAIKGLKLHAGSSLCSRPLTSD